MHSFPFAQLARWLGLPPRVNQNDRVAEEIALEEKGGRDFRAGGASIAAAIRATWLAVVHRRLRLRRAPPRQRPAAMGAVAAKVLQDLPTR
jgi:hypothetical protein